MRTLTGLAGGILIASAGCNNPRTEANVASALNDAATEINSMKSDIGQLQAEMDSLKTMLAKQDSLLGRIAAVNNIPR